MLDIHSLGAEGMRRGGRGRPFRSTWGRRSRAGAWSPPTPSSRCSPPAPHAGQIVRSPACACLQRWCCGCRVLVRPPMRAVRLRCGEGEVHSKRSYTLGTLEWWKGSVEQVSRAECGCARAGGGGAGGFQELRGGLAAAAQDLRHAGDGVQVLLPSAPGCRLCLRALLAAASMASKLS